MFSYFTGRNGYGKVPLLGTPRQTMLCDYIIYIEGKNYYNFTSVDESLVKLVAPYGTDFYWNYFNPAFAHSLAEFTKVLISMKVIKDKLPIIHGFRSKEFATSLSSNGRDSFWTPHRAGLAVDISCQDDIQRDRIMAEADAFGFGGMGRGRGWCHIDCGSPSAWGYDGIPPYVF